MKSYDQVALREELIRSLRRSLVGPYGVDDTAWTSAAPSATVVDESFKPDVERPLGPWVGPDGEEILDDLPYRIYTSGIVYPTGMKLATPIDAPEQDGPEVTADDVVASDSPDALDEDEVVADSIESGRSTLSFSVKVPPNAAEFKVRVDWGSYSPIDVPNVNQKWWHRRSYQVETTFNATSGTPLREFLQGPHRIVIGLSTRAQADGTSLVTIWMRNESPTVDDLSQVSATLFQTRLSAYFTHLSPQDSVRGRSVDEVDLLYRGVETFAIGHGNDVSVEHAPDLVVVSTVPMPVIKVPALTPDVRSSRGVPYGISMEGLATNSPDASAEVELLINDYRAWIQQLGHQFLEVDSRFRELAQDNLTACETFLADMSEGWRLVQTDQAVAEVFRDMSRAMNMQRRAYSSNPRTVTADANGGSLVVSGMNPHSVPFPSGIWRPFQIAFILANLKRVVDHSGRDLDVDLIWMPTGGGKTEAYLGLAAFVILWSRQTDPQGVGSKPSTKVLMRYTYRLLTIQQLVRAAALICALERIREESPSRYGESEVRIGCWLGNATTPGSAEQAVKDVSQWAKQGKDLERGPFVLTKCPWCGCEMGKKWGGSVIGYRKTLANGKQRILLHCPSNDCEFSFREVMIKGKKRERGIPLLYADDEVYAFPPDFVVGTIDKVAMMAWRTESGRLFGVQSGKRVSPPPSLLIQDELHLITGSLGSLDAMYEATLEALCLHDGGRLPLIVASSATTRNYRGQIQSLYGRGSRIVPPLGFDISDSFFARQDDDLPGKKYVAISASGFVSAANLQTRVGAVLGHFVPVVDREEWDIDAYWTNVLFFSSRRALARMITTVEDSMRLIMRAVRRASGLSSGKDKDGTRTGTRPFYRQIQITATSSDDVNRALEQLEQRLPSSEVIDICFATSMIEVGLDVPRLGLMSVMGQPKSSSQYIQVTGRVGRGNNGPALIAVVLNHSNVRDLSHFETFTMFHERLYASVEPASVTPFTYQALSRTVRGCSAILAQIAEGPASKPGSAIPAVQQLHQYVTSSRSLTEWELSALERVFSEIEGELKNPSVADLAWTGPKSPFLILGYGDVEPPDRVEPIWRVMRSMRSVDADALARIMVNADSAKSVSSIYDHTVDTEGSDL